MTSRSIQEVVWKRKPAPTSYFPIVISFYKNGGRRTVLCREPDDIPSGVAFKILATNVEIPPARKKLK
jgi:hypothetical protein